MTAPGSARPFVPGDFPVPGELVTAQFRLEPLGPQHNAGDYDAWTSSMAHIRATPGFAAWSWPRAMTPEQNLGDLRRHAEDFAGRTGFTYTVLDPAGHIVGCVYIYPAKDAEAAPGSEAAAGGEGAPGSNGAPGDDGAPGGQGAAGGEAAVGGEGAPGGEAAAGGEGVPGEDGTAGGEGAVGGEAAAGGEGSPGGAVVEGAVSAAGVADVHSWVRADRAELDVPLYAAVSAWLADAWPFAEVRYAPRARAGGGTAGTGA
jgi:hypothetical protein